MTNAPLRIGILGAAGITPNALIQPARDNPDVELVAVAARNRARAEEFAAEHGIGQVLDSYEELVTSPDIDAVYIPLPNSHHGPWTIAAIKAGKHVLVEKPFASNAAEAEEVAAVAATSDVVVMEAFHYRYHPLMQRAAEIVSSGAIGDVVDATATFNIHLPDRTNIRYVHEVAGGATMDLGCYSLHLVRSLIPGQPTVTSASYRAADDPRIDESLTAQLTFPGGATATVSSSLLEDVEVQSAVITGTLGKLEIDGFVIPQNGNELRLTVDGETTVWQAPTDPTSYRCQLDAFVAAVRDGAPILTGTDDSVAQMHVIDALYRAAGLEPRETLQD